jgi:hypothetical protein
MGTDSGSIDVNAWSQVLGVAGGWFVAVALLFGGGGFILWLLLTGRLVVGSRLDQLQEAYEREQERGDTLAQTLLQLQPGVQMAVRTVEQFRSLTINGDPPERQGIGT